MEACSTVIVAVDFDEDEADGRRHLVTVGSQFIPRLMGHGVKVIFHSFKNGFKVVEFDWEAFEHVLQGNENGVIVGLDGACVGQGKFLSNVNEGHHTAGVFVLGKCWLCSQMDGINNGLSLGGRHDKFRRCFHVRFLVTVNDVVHPAAECIHRMNGFSLLNLEG